MNLLTYGAGAVQAVNALLNPGDVALIEAPVYACVPIRLILWSQQQLTTSRPCPSPQGCHSRVSRDGLRDDRCVFDCHRGFLALA